MKKDEALNELENRYQWIGFFVLWSVLAGWGVSDARRHQEDPTASVAYALAFGSVIIGPFVYAATTILARKVWERRDKEN